MYVNKTQEAILDVKKDFLKDTINNLISEIDAKRKAKGEYMEKLVANTLNIFNVKVTHTDVMFKDFIISFFRDNSDYEFWTVLVWNNKENKAIYTSKNLSGHLKKVTLSNIKYGLSSYRIVTRGDETVVFGISKDYIDELVKAEISETIRDLKFENGSYVWINEILNYQGGKNYAVRKVHPNLPGTEGMYLSTDMTDGKGNFPYLTELQGINKDGELFFSYYFKEPDNNTISKKLTYAKLYRDYNWVVATGIYLNDLQSYIDKTSEESRTLASRLTLVLVFLFIIILFVSYSLIVLIEKLYYRHFRKVLESEINQDSLTKAASRKSGTNDLNRAFKEYRNTGSNHCIMMFDIDNFKHINDKYGHTAGDLVLTQIIKVIYRAIRSSDKLIRWGGDEFVIIFYGLQKENAPLHGQKILSIVSSLKIPYEDNEINTSISIGFTFFKETDSEYGDVLKRADEALYISKSNGRNQVNSVL